MGEDILEWWLAYILIIAAIVFCARRRLYVWWLAFERYWAIGIIMGATIIAYKLFGRKR